jgi:transposase
MFNPPDYIEQMLVALEGVTAQIKLATKEMRRIAHNDTACALLMTVPGVGPITAVRFVAALDETERFKSAHFVQAYLGLVPGEHSSGERTQRTSITKAGSAAVRWTLVQAAWSARRHRPNDAMVVWSKQVEQRRGKFIAVVALARKLAGVLHAIWRDGRPYQPTPTLTTEAAM